MNTRAAPDEFSYLIRTEVQIFRRVSVSVSKVGQYCRKPNERNDVNRVNTPTTHSYSLKFFVMETLDQFKLVRVRIMAESLLTLLMANLLQLIVFIFSWTNEDLSRTNATDEGFIAENSLLSTQSPLAIASNLTT